MVPVAAVAVATESAARTVGAALSATASAQCKAARSTRAGERKGIKDWVRGSMRNVDELGKKDGPVQVSARDEGVDGGGKSEWSVPQEKHLRMIPFLNALGFPQ